MRYPANQVIACLKTYDALPLYPSIVDSVVMPDLKARLDSYFSQAHELDRLYQFQASLRSQWNDEMMGRTIYNAQNLDVTIARDGKTINLEWCLLSGSGGRRHLQVDVGLLDAEAECRLTLQRDRLNAIATYVHHLDKGRQ